jgi:hypothetical protein
MDVGQLLRQNQESITQSRQELKAQEVKFDTLKQAISKVVKSLQQSQQEIKLEEKNRCVTTVSFLMKDA